MWKFQHGFEDQVEFILVQGAIAVDVCKTEYVDCYCFRFLLLLFYLCIIASLIMLIQALVSINITRFGMRQLLNKLPTMERLN